MRKLIFLLLFLTLAACTLGHHETQTTEPAPTQPPTNEPTQVNPTQAPSPTYMQIKPSETPPTLISEPRRPAIASISICSPQRAGGAGSCPDGSFDTQQIVLTPDGSGASINKFDHITGITDEHSSIFAPGMLGSNKDYLFFVASGSDQNRSMGVLVLSGGAGPDGHGQWTFDYPKADGYGSYQGGFGQILLPPTQQGHCPTLPGGNPAQQDQTFDLNYAAAGSLVVDSTGLAGSLLMVYEGANTCEGVESGRKSGEGSYITTGLATSRDYGYT